MDQVPKLRFPGFNDAWKKHKFSDGISEIGDGLHGTPIYNDNGSIYFINGNNLIDGKVTIDAETKTVDENQQSAIDKSLNKSTILMSINGTIGNLAYYSGEKIKLGKSAAYIKVSQYDKKFVYAYLQAPSAKKYFFDSLTGTTIKNLGLKAIRDMNLMMPDDTNEQKRIGELFSLLDTAINIYQRKLDDIKLLKQSMLQKMFPKDGEDKPEIRFPGFTDAWEQRKLGEISEIVGGGTPSTSIAEYWDGDIDWYAPAEIGEQIYVNSSKKKITKAGLEDSSAKILPIGTILFTSRAGIGNTAILAKNGATNQGFQSIIPIQNVLDTYFLFSMTNQLKRYGEITGAGSTFVEVSGKQMAKMELMLPSYNEQQQIGAFFKNLDDLITLHQRKLDDTKLLKQALLQQMFI